MLTKADILTEYVISDILDFMTSEMDIKLEEAMEKFYSSVTFSKLCDKETALYRESSGYVYDLFLDELENGKFIQREV